MPTTHQHLAASLVALAEEIAHFADAATERLPYGEHADLMEMETRLRSYAELLAADDPVTFLTEQRKLTREHFQYLQMRVGPEAAT